jgi:hypothetical protein
MPGEFWPFYATKAFTRLLASAAALTAEDGTSAIFVSADYSIFDTSHAYDMRRRIFEATGVPMSNILIGATHSHTSVSDHRVAGLCPAEPERGRKTERRIVEAGIKAWEARSDAKIGFGKGEDRRMSFCRDCIMKDGRIVSIPGKAASDNIEGYLGVVDYDVHVVRIDAPDGKIRGFIVNYANHPDNHKKRQFSGDFPAYMREALKEKFGEDVTVLFFNGGAGNVNAFDYKNNTDWYNASGEQFPPMHIGNMLAETVCKINETIETKDTEVLKVLSVLHTYKKRVPADWEMQQALEIKSRIDADEEVASGDIHVSRKVLAYNPNNVKTMDLEMQAIRIGDWTVITTPGELYSELTLAIKAGSPFETTSVFELTNGSEGYVPPDSVLGSKAYGGRFYAGNLGYGAADTIINGAIELLNKI